MNKNLLIVDMQNGFMDNDKYINLRNNIDNYILNSKYENYIFTKFINTKNSLFEKKLKWYKLNNKKDQEICLNIPKNNIIFEKYGYGLDLEQIKEIKQLVNKEEAIDICGLESDSCVYAIALQLFDEGIYPNILFDYIDTDNCEKKLIENIFIHQFGGKD